MVRRSEAASPGGARARPAAPALIAIFVLALALRCAAVGVIGPNPAIAGYSESGIVADNLARGLGYTYDFYQLRTDAPLRAFIPPLYVGLIYACLRLSDQPALALALVQALLSGLACLAIYGIAAQLSGSRTVALLAGLAAACYPVSVLMVTVPTSLTLHATVLAWAVAVTLRLARGPGPGWALLAGALWGAIALGRPALLGFLPFVLLWLAWNRAANRRWLRDGAALVVAAALVVLPWTVRNVAELGRLVPISTNGGLNFWNGSNPFTTGSGHDVYTEKADAYLGRVHDPGLPAVMQMQPYPLPPDIRPQVATLPETELDRRLFRAGLDFIRAEPRAWLALSAQKLAAFWWFRENLGAAYQASWAAYYRPVYALLLLLLVAGAALAARRWRRYGLLYLLFGYYAVTNVAFQVLTRFRWEIEPFFLIFAALAAVTLFDRVVAARGRRAPILDPG